MGPNAMIFFFWMLSFKPAFSLSSFNFIKRLFSCTSLSAISVVITWISEVTEFFPRKLYSSLSFLSPAFHMMYSAYKLNKQGENIQPWHTPFSILNLSVVAYLVLTVASWPEYRFLRRLVRWSSSPVSLRIFHSLLLSKQSKALVWSMTEKQMFVWNLLPSSTIQQMLAVWSLVPLPFLNPTWTFGSSPFTYCWNQVWRILSITLLICEMTSILQRFEHSLALPFFGIGMKTDLFQSCGHCWVFQICWCIECSTFIVLSFRIWNSSAEFSHFH